MRSLIGIMLAFWALPIAAQESYTAHFHNPGETLTLDFMPQETGETPEQRHAKIDAIWADILRANGYWSIGTPTKTATGMVMAQAYHPEKASTLHYQILYSWDYKARITFLAHEPDPEVSLVMDLSAFRSLTIAWDAPAYCKRTADGGYFDTTLNPEQKTQAFEAAGCDPQAYEDIWQNGGEMTLRP